MKDLDKKLNLHFAGKVVRKDLTKLVKGNAIVPTYVLEYLLGQYCATDDEPTINHGIETVKSIISKHFVHRDEAEIVKSTIKEKQSHRIIDKVTVSLNETKGFYEASFVNLNIKKVIVDSQTLKEHPRLLSAGVWCIVNLSFLVSEEKGVSPWLIESIKPIQVSNVNIAEYKKLRAEFSKEEWLNILMQSIGLVPEQFNLRSKLIQLSRLIPFCENNFNFIELGPKGTGKSHLFSELSPHGILVSGGEVSIPNLFINNTTGRMGLVGYWDVVTFDEFAGTGKKGDANLKDIMQNYMANKSFSRGKDVFGAAASMAFVGNTEHAVPYMLKNSNLFEALPQTYLNSAFLDRMHTYVPGWEVSKLRNEMFSSDYGFIVDYLAEIMKELRKEDFTNGFRQFFELSSAFTARDRDGIVKTFSGFIKILYPDGSYSKAEAQEVLDFSMECRKRIKDQLIRIDDTFEPIDFCYKDLQSGEIRYIETLENEIYGYAKPPKETPPATIFTDHNPQLLETASPKSIPEPHHEVFRDNQTGVSYLKLFGNHLKGARKITLTDPYIRLPYQFRFLLELCVMLSKIKTVDEEIDLHVITWNEDNFKKQSEEILYEVMLAVEVLGINLSYSFKDEHDRSIISDNGWKIILGRGLDIFEKEEARFNIGDFEQEHRKCKNFTVTYLKIENS